MKNLFTFALVLFFIGAMAQETRKGPAPLFPNGSRSMIVVQDLDSGPTANDLVEAILPVGTSYSNVTTSLNPSLGLFSGGTAASFGLDEGIVLGSGCVNWLTSGVCTWVTMPGDPDLDNLGTGYVTCDAAILEFDFIASSNQLELSYIYGANDYFPFGDPCAIFLDGVNIATINGGQEVSLRTTEFTNCFIQNTGNVEVEIDDYTPVFHATSALTIGQTYHLKIAVADDLDCDVPGYIFVSPGLIGEGQCCCTDSRIPISNWALVIAMVAIGMGIVIRFRRS